MTRALPPSFVLRGDTPPPRRHPQAARCLNHWGHTLLNTISHLVPLSTGTILAQLYREWHSGPCCYSCRRQITRNSHPSQALLVPRLPDSPLCLHTPHIAACVLALIRCRSGEFPHHRTFSTARNCVGTFASLRAYSAMHYYSPVCGSLALSSVSTHCHIGFWHFPSAIHYAITSQRTLFLFPCHPLHYLVPYCLLCNLPGTRPPTYIIFSHPHYLLRNQFTASTRITYRYSTLADCTHIRSTNPLSDAPLLLRLLLTPPLIGP